MTRAQVKDYQDRDVGDSSYIGFSIAKSIVRQGGESFPENRGHANHDKWRVWG